MTVVLEYTLTSEAKDFFELDVGEYSRNNHKFFVGRGFGYQRNSEGIPIHRNHNHKVQLHISVQVGNGTNIDIGRDRNTVIDEFTVIDSLVHIGHSAIIGKKCIIVSGTVIGGHVEIGDGCHIGMNVSIKQGVKIGKGCFIGAGSYVNKDIPDRSVAYGVPATIRKDYKNEEYISRSIHFEK